MFKRLAIMASTLLIVLGLNVAPAQAAFGGTCSSNSFCLYQWTGLGAQVEGNRWQTSFANILAHGGCINIPNATWANGTAVSDNSGSLMYVATSGYGAYVLDVYNWANCNAAGQYRIVDYMANGTQGSYDNLSSYQYQYPSGTTMTLYHTITSVSLENPLG